MLHHCFEHMSNPEDTLRNIYGILKPDGCVLIRIPVASSYAWKTYRTNWVQLDAPRHFFLHTEESIKILARKTGFMITEVVYDSTEFQFWGSEQHRHDIALFEEHSYRNSPRRSIFTKNQIKTFKAEARELNSKREGDQACFYLRKLPIPSTLRKRCKT